MNLGLGGWCRESVEPALQLAEQHSGAIVAVSFTETHFGLGSMRPGAYLPTALERRWVFIRSKWGLASRKRKGRDKGGVLLAVRKRGRGFVYRNHVVLRPESSQYADTMHVRVEYLCHGGVVSMELFPVYLAGRCSHRATRCTRAPERCSHAHPSLALPLVVQELAMLDADDPGRPTRVAFGDFNAPGGGPREAGPVSTRLKKLDALMAEHRVVVANEPFFTRVDRSRRPSMIDLFLVPESQRYDTIGCRPIWDAFGGNPLGHDHLPTVLWVSVRVMPLLPGGASLFPSSVACPPSSVAFDPRPVYDVLSRGDPRSEDATRVFLDGIRRSGHEPSASGPRGDILEGAMDHALLVVGAAVNRYRSDGSRVKGWNALRRELEAMKRAGASDAECAMRQRQMKEARSAARRRSRRRRQNEKQALVRQIMDHPNPSIGSAMVHRDLYRSQQVRQPVFAGTLSETLRQFHGSMVVQRCDREQLASSFDQSPVRARERRIAEVMDLECAGIESGEEAYKERVAGEHLARLCYANRPFSVEEAADAVGSTRLSSSTRSVPSRACHLFFPESAIGRGRIAVADAEGENPVERAVLERDALQVLADHANAVLQPGGVEECHTSVRLTPIPKPGKEGKPLHESHRFIGVGSLVASLVGRMLKSRLSRFLEEMSRDPVSVQLGYGFTDADCGFRPRRGTVEAVFEVCSFTDVAERSWTPMQLSFYDVRGAFPSIPWSSLVVALFDRGLCGGPLFRALVAWVQQSSTHFRVGPRRSEDLPMERGVVEGGAFSPIMFASAFSPLCRKVTAAVRQAVGGDPGIDGSGVLLYADDHVRLDASRHGLEAQVQAGSDATASFFAEHQLSAGFGPGKTAVLRNTAAVFKAELVAGLEAASSFGEQSVPCVDEYTYLGVLICPGGAAAISEANWARRVERLRSIQKEMRYSSGIGITRAAVGRVCWLAQYVTVLYYAVGAWSCTVAPGDVVGSHAAAARAILRCPRAPASLSLFALGLRPHFALVARARIDLVALAMSRAPDTRLRSRLVGLWRELRQDESGGPWASSLLSELERIEHGVAVVPPARSLVGELDFGLLGLDGRGGGSDPGRGLPPGVVAAEEWVVRGATHSRFLRAVDACVVRELCAELSDSFSGTYDDALRLLWRPAVGVELQSPLCARGLVPRWPDADPSVPFPMIDAPRDDAFFCRSRAVAGWRCLVGSRGWDEVRRSGCCVLCGARAGDELVPLSFEHLFLGCPGLDVARGEARGAVTAVLESMLEDDEAALAVESARAAFGGPDLAAGLGPDERGMWVCLVLGWPAVVPFMPRYCDPPTDGEEGADGGRSRRLRRAVLASLGPLVSSLRALWEVPTQDR